MVGPLSQRVCRSITRWSQFVQLIIAIGNRWPIAYDNVRTQSGSTIERTGSKRAERKVRVQSFPRFILTKVSFIEQAGILGSDVIQWDRSLWPKIYHIKYSLWTLGIPPNVVDMLLSAGCSQWHLNLLSRLAQKWPSISVKNSVILDGFQVDWDAELSRGVESDLDNARGYEFLGGSQIFET